MSAFEQIAAGLNDAIAHTKGDASRAALHIAETIDVKAIRTANNMTQQVFAETFGFDTSAVKEWEQKRRQPERSARILLTMIAREPETVKRVLHEVV